MKIKFQRGDVVFEIERKPMPPERFKTVCAALLAILYTVAVVAIVAISGVESFLILLPVTAAFCGAMCWVLGVSL